MTKEAVELITAQADALTALKAERDEYRMAAEAEAEIANEYRAERNAAIAASKEQALAFGRWMVLDWCQHHRDGKTGQNMLRLDREDLEPLFDMWLKEQS